MDASEPLQEIKLLSTGPVPAPNASVVVSGDNTEEENPRERQATEACFDDQ